MSNNQSKFYYLLIINLLMLQYSYSQQTNLTSGWKISEPFSSNVFIENKGQFNNLNSQTPNHVLYGINSGGLKVYFTPTGLSYHITNIKLKDHYKNDKHEVFEKMEENARKNVSSNKLKKYFNDLSANVNIEWENANPYTQLVVSEKYMILIPIKQKMKMEIL